ncbi:MAG: phenylacetate--CoA ligase family protein [Fimbriimonadales bacterium]|nr:phenylacetate--CoA ligase family protein [Fimbriimonadales bacterium]
MNFLEAFDKGTRGAALDAIRRSYRFLYESQRVAPEDIREYKLSRLKKTYSYAKKHVAYYQKAYSHLPDAIDSWQDFLQLPILTREDASRAGEKLRGDQPPPGARPLEAIRTSGTTGNVVECIPTEVSEQFRSAVSLREFEWAEINPAGSAFLLRALVKPGHPDSDALRSGVRAHSWATGYIAQFIDTGPGYFIDVSASSRHIAEFLIAAKPDFILAFPSALAEVAKWVDPMPVRFVRTIGETLHDEWRDPITKAFACKIQDLYSAQEVGPIAVSCPDGGGYHTMDEWVHVEILRDDGTPCDPGEQGRVVVTHLHPYLTPFIRYDLGDRATRGGLCKCGRSLATLEEILGRSFGFVRMPDGTMRSASPMFYAFTGIEGLFGAQIEQPAINAFKVAIVGNNAAVPQVEHAMRETVGDSASISIEIVNELSRSNSGKIERFRWTGN